MIRNEDIWKKTENIVDIIKKRKLRLLGYRCQMNGNNLVKHVLFMKIKGKKPVGIIHVENDCIISKTAVGTVDKSRSTWHKAIRYARSQLINQIGKLSMSFRVTNFA